MALSKIQAESMNLADTYAFTGTVSGLPSGSSAFMARMAVTGAWVSINQDELIYKSDTLSKNEIAQAILINLDY